VLVVTTFVFSSVRFSAYTDILFSERISVAANGLKKYMDDCERDSKIAALTASTDANVISAIANRDRDEIINVLSSSMDLYHVNFFTVTDADGIVLARTHEQNMYGDSIAYQKNIQEALSGAIYTCIEEGTVVKVSVRTGAPVYDTEGTLVGAISAGKRFDINETLDRLKEHYHAEFGVYINDVLISATVKINGERIIGWPLNPDTKEKVYSTKKGFYGASTVENDTYSLFYLPLLRQGVPLLSFLLRESPCN